MTEVPVYTAEQVRAAERPLLAARQPLMARAAAALAEVIRTVFEQEHETPHPDAEPVESASVHAPHVLVIAGSGDNGGDALYAAAHLADEIDVDVITVGARVHDMGLATALGAGARRVEVPALRDSARDYDIIVDGILGIGVRELDLRGNAREVVEALLPAVQDGRSRVVAVDMPSGLHPDTGEVGETVLPASVTVTFGAVKAGLVQGRGPEYAGKIVLADIGIGANLEGFLPVGSAEVDRVIDSTGG